MTKDQQSTSISNQFAQRSALPAAPRRGPVVQAEFLYNPPELGLYCHCPSLVYTTGGDLLAVWYAYPEQECAEGSLVLARRPAGESRWIRGRKLFGHLKSSAGNPVLLEEPGGAIRLLFVLLKGKYWNDAELQSSVSRDGGLTWTMPSAMLPDRGLMARHPPVALADGSLLLPAYNEVSRQSMLLKSAPPHEEWKLAYRFESLGLIQPALVRMGPKQLAIFFRPSADPRFTWRSHSRDDGAIWSLPMQTTLPNPLSGLSAFTTQNRVTLVYNHTEEHQRYPLSLSHSSDEGVTWEGPWHIEVLPIEVSYPSFLADDKGSVHGVYTYNRRMIKYVSYKTERNGELLW